MRRCGLPPDITYQKQTSPWRLGGKKFHELRKPYEFKGFFAQGGPKPLIHKAFERRDRKPYEFLWFSELTKTAQLGGSLPARALEALEALAEGGLRDALGPAGQLGEERLQGDAPRLHLSAPEKRLDLFGVFFDFFCFFLTFLDLVGAFLVFFLSLGGVFGGLWARVPSKKGSVFPPFFLKGGLLRLGENSFLLIFLLGPRFFLFLT